MTDQPPVQPPVQPSREPAGRPAEGGSAPATESIPAATSGFPAAPAPRPRPNMWRETTSTRGGRWAIALAAGAVAVLLLLGLGMAGVMVLRHHDQFSPMGQRQGGNFRGQDEPGNGRGPGGNDMHQGGMPGAPGTRDGRAQGRGHGPGGLVGMMGGAALHGQVTATVDGSTQALVFQRGEVTAASATSLTLRSSDGFVGTYVLSSTTKAKGLPPVKGGVAFAVARASDKVALRTLAMPTGMTPDS